MRWMYKKQTSCSRFYCIGVPLIDVLIPRKIPSMHAWSHSYIFISIHRRCSISREHGKSKHMGSASKTHDKIKILSLEFMILVFSINPVQWFFLYPYCHRRQHNHWLVHCSYEGPEVCVCVCVMVWCTRVWSIHPLQTGHHQWQSLECMK